MGSEQFYVGIVRSVKLKPFSFKVQYLKRRTEYLWVEDREWTQGRHTVSELSHCISFVSLGPGHYLLDTYDTTGEISGEAAAATAATAALATTTSGASLSAPGEAGEAAGGGARHEAFDSVPRDQGRPPAPGAFESQGRGSCLRSVVQFMPDERMPFIPEES